MGRPFVVEREGPSYRCKFCETQLALAKDLLSQAFRCERGQAYLFSKAVNVIVENLAVRLMHSGLHTVGDISCCCCYHIVGWKYEVAHEKHQKYKEGKFMLFKEVLEGECNGDEYESDSCSESSINTPSTPSPESSINTPSTPSPIVSSGGVSPIVSSGGVSPIVSDGEDV